MGKLRDGILQTHQASGAIEKLIKETAEKADKLCHNQVQVFENNIKGGIEVLYLYLVERIKKANKDDTYDKHAKDTLAKYKDPNVEKFVAGIETGRKAAYLKVAEWEAFESSGPLGQLAKALEAWNKQLEGLGEQLASKKKKLFKSAKYKDKLATYEKAIGELAAKGKQLSREVKQIYPCLKRKHVDEASVTWTTTLGQLDSSLLMNVKTEVKNVETALAQGVAQRRKFHEGGDLVAARNILKAWADEADAMEAAESEGEEAASDTKRQIGTLVLSDFSTKKPVAKAKAGVWDAKAKTLAITGLEWNDEKKAPKKPLDYLQQKMMLSGVQLPDKAVFKADLKLVKLGGGFDKADFKG